MHQREVTSPSFFKQRQQKMLLLAIVNFLSLEVWIIPPADVCEPWYIKVDIDFVIVWTVQA